MGGPIKSPWEIISRAVVAVPGPNDKILFAPQPGVSFVTQAQATLVSSLFPSVNACLFPGATAGDKIEAAIASLPATGGIVDATCFEGAQSIPNGSTIFSQVTGPKTVVLLLGIAQFSVTQTIVLSHAANVRILGQSVLSTPSTSLSTELIWDGANGGTVLLLDCVRDSIVAGIGIVPGAGTVGIGVRLDHATAPVGSFISTNNTLQFVNIGPSTVGVQIGNTSIANNELHSIIDCNIYGAGTSGIFINNAQSKFIKIVRGNIGGRTAAVDQNNGSYSAIDVNLSGNTFDFRINSISDSILIEHCQSELSQQFIRESAGGFGFWNITLIGNRWDPGATNGTLISYAKLGALTLIGNDFAGGQFVAVSITANGTLDGGCRVVSIGNTYSDPLVFVNNPNATHADIYSIGDNAYAAGPTPVQMPYLEGSTYNGALILANGANNDIVISGGLNGSRYYRITGPTGAFSISGFTGGQAGQGIKVFNSTNQTMTIVDAAGSAAANQILTLTGANIVLRVAAQSLAEFIYDITLQKWILVGANGPILV